MYRQKIPQKTSPLVNSTPISKAAPTSSYGSLSSIVQRVQQDVNSISGDETQQLESAIGTKATGEVLTGKQWTPQFTGVSSQLWGNAGIQAKLTIGEVGDKYEQEADRVAASVVEQINRPATVSPTQGEMVQGKEQEEEEELRMKPMVQRKEAIGGGEASAELSGEINRARGGGQPLDVGLQQTMGQAMGADFSGVRVHTDGRSDQLNQSIQAKAFTTGQDVFFRQGEYQPRSRGGQELIAHELTHVVQQTGKGNRKPNNSEVTTSDREGNKRKGESWGAKKSENESGNTEKQRAMESEETEPTTHKINLAHSKGDARGRTCWVQRSEEININNVTVGTGASEVRLDGKVTAEADGGGLRVWGVSQDECSMRSKGFNADAKVHARGGKKTKKRYEIGFLQTVLESKRTGLWEPIVERQQGTDERCKKVRDAEAPKRDCVPDSDKRPWYHKDSVSNLQVNDEKGENGDMNEVGMKDFPAHYFPWRVTYKGVEQILVLTRALIRFRTWLAVRDKKKGKYSDIKCLGYIHWGADFDMNIWWDDKKEMKARKFEMVKGGQEIYDVGTGDGGRRPETGQTIQSHMRKRSPKIESW